MVLPRHTKVIITGNNWTKSMLVGLECVVKKAANLGGWHCWDDRILSVLTLLLGVVYLLWAQHELLGTINSLSRSSLANRSRQVHLLPPSPKPSMSYDVGEFTSPQARQWPSSTPPWFRPFQIQLDAPS